MASIPQIEMVRANARSLPNQHGQKVGWLVSYFAVPEETSP